MSVATSTSSQAATPRERRRAETRAEILDAAWELARRHGLPAFSMRDLGAEVGMRAQSLYAYFPSKAALYDAMFRQGYEQLGTVVADWPDTLADDPDPRATFTRLNREFAEFCNADAVRYQLLFQRVVPDWEPSAEAYAIAVEHLDRLRRALRSLGVDSRRATDLWTAIATGLTAQQLSNDPGGRRWLRLVDDAVDMFCDFVGIQPPTPASTSPTDRPIEE